MQSLHTLSPPAVEAAFIGDGRPVARPIDEQEHSGLLMEGLGRTSLEKIVEPLVEKAGLIF